MHNAYLNKLVGMLREHNGVLFDFLLLPIPRSFHQHQERNIGLQETAMANNNRRNQSLCGGPLENLNFAFIFEFKDMRV